MTKREFAKKIGISYGMWCAVLAGTRNLGECNADNVADLTGVKAEIWSLTKNKDRRPEKWAKIKGRKFK